MKTLNDETLKRVREFNIAYQQEHGITPSYRQIMNALKLGSLATVRRYVMELENQGILKRSEIGKIIPMPKLKKGNFVLAPLIGSIVCGIPNPSEENYEDTYALPTDIFGKGHLFMLHAEGNSVIEAGISPGDLLVLCRIFLIHSVAFFALFFFVNLGENFLHFFFVRHIRFFVVCVGIVG